LVALRCTQCFELLHWTKDTIFCKPLTQSFSFYLFLLLLFFNEKVMRIQCVRIRIKLNGPYFFAMKVLHFPVWLAISGLLHTNQIQIFGYLAFLFLAYFFLFGFVKS